jgi:CHAT domain-containing protein
MIAYYRLLQDGAGRGEALRRVQLAMLAGGQRAGDGQNKRGLDVRPGGNRAGGNWSHPFYWAAFIGSGAWQDMSERRAIAK